MSGRAATTTVTPGDVALSVGIPQRAAPAGWRWVSLGDVATLASGHTPSRYIPEYWGGSIPWIAVADARSAHGGVISSSNETTNQLGIDNSAAVVLPAGTVCLSRTGSIGYSVILGKPMATSQGFVNWICGPALVPEFLRDLFVAENSFLHRIAEGMAHTTIYFPEVKAFALCLPPINEQRRIVAKLETLQSHSRRAREALDALPPLLEKFRQSILAAAFRGDLTKDWRAKNKDVEPASELLKRIRVERRKKWEQAELVKMKAKGKAPKDDTWKAKYNEPEPVDTTGLPGLPEGWCWASVDEVAFVTKLAGFEYTKHVKYDPTGDLPVIKAENVSKQGFVRTEFSRVVGSSVERLTRSALRADDVLMVFVGAGLGQVARVPRGERFFLGPNVAMIRCDSGGVDSAFVEYFFRSPFGFSLSRGESKSTAQGSISMEQIRGVAVAVAPRAEQQAVLSKLNALLPRLGAFEAVRDELVRTTAALERSVLAAAFRGELVPRDPNDEPADAMLARMRTTNGAAEKKDRKVRGEAHT